MKSYLLSLFSLSLFSYIHIIFPSIHISFPQTSPFSFSLSSLYPYVHTFSQPSFLPKSPSHYTLSLHFSLTSSICPDPLSLPRPFLLLFPLSPVIRIITLSLNSFHHSLPSFQQTSPFSRSTSNTLTSSESLLSLI